MPKRGIILLPVAFIVLVIGVVASGIALLQPQSFSLRELSDRIFPQGFFQKQETSLGDVQLSEEPYVHPSLGVVVRAAKNWEKVEEAENSTTWDVKQDDQVVAKVQLREISVLSETSEATEEQSIPTVINGVSGERKLKRGEDIWVESFVFAKEGEGGQRREYVLELVIPNPHSLLAHIVASIRRQFEEFLRTLAFVSIPRAVAEENKEKVDKEEERPASAISETTGNITLSKAEVIADGEDSAIVTVNAQGEKGEPLKGVYVNIVPSDPTDIGENKIVPKSQRPTDRTNFQVATINDSIAVVGGRYMKNIAPEDQYPVPTVELYKPQEDSWKKLSDMLQPRDAFGLLNLRDKLYAVFGRGALHAVPAPGIDVFEFTSKDEGKWGSILPAPQSGSQGYGISGAAWVLDDKIYSLEVEKDAYTLQSHWGTEAYFTRCGDKAPLGVRIIDVKEKKTEVIKDGESCGEASPGLAVTYGKKLYLFGGLVDRISTKDIFVFDTETNRWNKIGSSLPLALVPVAPDRVGGGVVLINGKIFLFGVRKDVRIYNPKKDPWYVYVYDPEKDSWVKMGEFPLRVYNFAYTRYNDKIYLFSNSFRIPGREVLYNIEVYEFTPAKTLREPVINPTNEEGIAQFRFRSVFPGKREYKAVFYDSSGKEVELGKFSITFK